MSTKSEYDMNCKQLLSELGVDKELVMEFFVVFSRFEFALKKAKYLKKKNGKAFPDWDAFSKKHKDGFNPKREIQLKEAWDFLKKEPPMTQIVFDGQLDFKVDKQLTGKFSLFEAQRAVRTVRNNLFHGGKFPKSGVVDDPARKTKLLSMCLVLLKEMLKLDPVVKEHFDDIELSRLLCD